MKPASILCCAVLTHCATAAAVTAAFDYRIGATGFTEDEHGMLIHAHEPLKLEVRPGGRVWPPLVVDDGGRIYAGGTVIDALSGRVLQTAGKGVIALPYGVQVAPEAGGFRFRRSAAPGRDCLLPLRKLNAGGGKPALQAMKDANVAFASSPRGVVGLATHFGADGKVSGYTASLIDAASCKVAHSTPLGNPDLLVELAASKSGGWWITGSVEQTLLRSADGRSWRKVPLPAQLSSLVSSYAVNDREIWLAAAQAGDGDDKPYMLTYSGDGGASWASLRRDDPLLGRLPPAWLEGQRRRASGGD
ncbi:hypothetical protein [Massilia sp. Root351]|jgi:hypothetical protein|uniref:hypothetical protein n=1 Tax=Massilia sp. Root351 TaxID=1736522 RepID=UPI000A5B01D0|nr:hypothetical protein [Massilia sp. Root351]